MAVGEHHGALRANSEATGGNYTRLLAPVKSLALQFYFQGSFDARPVATALQALLANKVWGRAKRAGNGELVHSPDIGRLTVADIPKVRKLPLVYDGI